MPPLKVIESKEGQPEEFPLTPEELNLFAELTANIQMARGNLFESRKQMIEGIHEIDRQLIAIEGEPRGALKAMLRMRGLPYDYIFDATKKVFRKA